MGKMNGFHTSTNFSMQRVGKRIQSTQIKSSWISLGREFTECPNANDEIAK